MEVIKMQKKFSGKTDVQKVKQLNQQAESNKQQASGRFGQQNTEEFGAETDVCRHHLKRSHRFFAFFPALDVYRS